MRYLPMTDEDVTYLTELLQRCCEANLATVGEVKSRLWSSGILPAREMFSWCAHHSGYSYPKIGSFLSGRNHTTILYAKRRFSEKLANAVWYYLENEGENYEPEEGEE